MKKLLSTCLILLTLFSGKGLYAEDVIYPDEEEDIFNHGKMVGKETDEYERARKRTRFKNWGLAVTTTALGVATLVIVGQNHKK